MDSLVIFINSGCKYSGTRKLILFPQLLQKYQMVLNGPAHCGIFAIRNAIFFGGLFHDPCQRSIVSVADKRTEMMDDMVVEPASKPTDQRLRGRVIGGCREDVIDPVVELAAVRGKVSAVNTVCGLKYERYAQTDDQMGKHERQSDQQRRFPEHQDRQNQHVGEVEPFAGKKDDVFSH